MAEQKASRSPARKRKGRATEEVHPDHGPELHRLNRIIGQLEGIRRMVEERRYCADILIQTRAASSAIRSFETSILETHVRHCVTAALASKNKREAEAKMWELMELLEKRL